MTDIDPLREGTDIHDLYNHCAVMAKLDTVLANARRRQAQEMDRLMRTGLGRCRLATLALVGPVFGWNRHALDPRSRHDRQTSLGAYVDGLRADAERSGKNQCLGHGA